ncbi:transposase [bacterium]|nr:transposase [bacterium]
MDYARQLRQASGLPQKNRKGEGKVLLEEDIQDLPSMRTITWWVFRSPDKWRDEDEQTLARAMGDDAKLQTYIALAREFADIVRTQKSGSLDAWIVRARESGSRIWGNFSQGLEQDKAAVRAALTYAWSNGRTEGNVNRLKTLKRMMYGRANDDLLRKRVMSHIPVFT